jgi:hypothetical protein
MRVAFVAAVLIVLGVVPSLALPLDLAQCAALESERRTLVADRVDVSLALGPEWAKAHLTSQQIQAVYRLLELKEQVMFRCPTLNPDAAPDPNEGDDIYGPPEPEKPKVVTKTPAKKAGRGVKVKAAASTTTVKAAAKSEQTVKPKLAIKSLPVLSQKP